MLARQGNFDTQACLLIQSAAAVAPGDPCRCLESNAGSCDPNTPIPVTPQPTSEPTFQPSLRPSVSGSPSAVPSSVPSALPSSVPSAVPSELPSVVPSVVPSTSIQPSIAPSVTPETFVCGKTWTEDDIIIVLEKDEDCSGDPSTILRGRNQILDCRGFTIVDDTRIGSSPGSIILEGGTTMQNCVINGNSAENGIIVDSSSTMPIGTDVFVFDNVTVIGGFAGLEFFLFTDMLVPEINITNSAFLNNSLTGIYFSSDSGDFVQPVVRIVDTVASYNTFEGIGGCSEAERLDLTLIRVTVEGNRGDGINIRNCCTSVTDTLVKISDSVVCGNGASDPSDNFDIIITEYTINDFTGVVCDTLREEDNSGPFSGTAMCTPCPIR